MCGPALLARVVTTPCSFCLRHRRVCGSRPASYSIHFWCAGVDASNARRGLMAASCSSLSTSHSVSFVDHDLAFGDHVADVRRDGDEDLVTMAIDLLVELGPLVRAAPETASERE